MHYRIMKKRQSAAAVDCLHNSCFKKIERRERREKVNQKGKEPEENKIILLGNVDNLGPLMAPYTTILTPLLPLVLQDRYRDTRLKQR